MRRFDVAPDGDGIVSVRHSFGTRDVMVRCERADGSPVKYLLVNVITPDEVEVLTVPGSGVAAAIVWVREEFPQDAATPS